MSSVHVLARDTLGIPAASGTSDVSQLSQQDGLPRLNLHTGDTLGAGVAGGSFLQKSRVFIVAVVTLFMKSPSGKVQPGDSPAEVPARPAGGAGELPSRCGVSHLSDLQGNPDGLLIVHRNVQL